MKDQKYYINRLKKLESMFKEYYDILERQGSEEEDRYINYVDYSEYSFGKTYSISLGTIQNWCKNFTLEGLTTLSKQFILLASNQIYAELRKRKENRI